MRDPEGNKSGPATRPQARPALLVKEHEVPLAEGVTVIGRGGSAHISISGSLVSREHARLICTDLRVTVEDAGSRNGVFVNGMRLDSPALLEDGDTLLVGTTQLTFFLTTGDDAAPPRRIAFDEQGNMIALDEVADALTTRTEIRFEDEVDDTLDYDRDELTVQGQRPPAPRMVSALRQIPAPATEPPPAPQTTETLTAADPRPPSAMPLARVRMTKAAARPSSPPRVGPVRSVTPSTSPYAAPPPSTGAYPAVPGQDPMVPVLGVVERMLGRGDVDAATRSLAGNLDKRIDALRHGQALSEALLEQASLAALGLLELSGDPEWFDRVVELHLAAEVPMGHAVLDRATPFVGVVPSASQSRLAEYQNLIRERLGDVEVRVLERCERILALGS